MWILADKHGIAGSDFHGAIRRLGGAGFKVFRRKQEPHEGSDSLRVVGAGSYGAAVMTASSLGLPIPAVRDKGGRLGHATSF